MYTFLSRHDDKQLIDLLQNVLFSQNVFKLDKHRAEIAYKLCLLVLYDQPSLGGSN